jgi:RNA polymerase sigma factor (sigma-70 family)
VCKIDFEGQLSVSFQANRSQLKRLAQKILGSADRAEDLIQDVYLKIIQLETTIEARQPLAYLSRVVRNMAIDVKRREVFEYTYFLPEEEGVTIAAPAPSPEARLITAQSLSLVATALKKLPERTQRVFEMYRLDGLTQREVAEALGVSVTLVNFMIRDALTQCKDAL